MTNTHLPGWQHQQAESDAPTRRSHLGREDFAQPRPRRWKHRHAVIAAAVVLLLAIGGGAGAWWNAALNSELKDAAVTAEAARDDLTQMRSSAMSVLASAVKAVGITDPSADDGGAAQVDEVLADACASKLAEAIAAVGDDQLRVPDADGPWLERAQRRDAINAYAVTAADLTQELSASTVALRDSLAAWQLAQATAALDQARAGLDAALTDAQRLLDGSLERVLDDSTRWALTDAIAAAQQVRATPVDAANLDALVQAAAEMTAQIEPLNAAAGAVTEATAAWQAEQDRIADEKSAAAARSAGASKGSASSSTGTKSSTKKSSSSSGTSGGASVPSGQTGSTSGGTTTGGGSGGTGGGSTWVESGPDTWCFQGDTSGTEGTGGWC